ncbi:DUF4349 domain-containing protein [Trichococcus collinsii]|uniref:DUF4349 domain-containing protein n=1 Tax=Trichococcus collinsii TaxID=157076 RepID=A0AB37ZZ04_9LACT|nr:DUF4349 domain-containing protein [Trichococcus collinsii]CZR09643.1 Hypothetical protein Tcol_2936 [Trichococcus collinsii]SEA14004.1 protein of unknown function [Trichococcus collinsii]
MKNLKLLILSLLSFSLVGCSFLTTEETSVSQQDAAGVDNVTTEISKMDGEVGSGLLIGEKVVTTVHLSYETLKYDDSIAYLKEIVGKYGAYVEYSYESSGGDMIYTPSSLTQNYRQGSYTIRIPKDSVTAFLDDLEGGLGTKISEQQGNEDVTQYYEDTATRISVLQRKEERLLALLDQAVTVEEILAIEDSLSAAIAEREVLQSELDNIDDLIDYTALYLTVSERSRISNNQGGSTPFWDRVKDAFIDSLYSFYYWLQDAAIWFIYAMPFFVAVLLLLLLLWAIKKLFGKTIWGKQRAEKQLQERKQIEERRKERFERTHPRKPGGTTVVATKATVTPPVPPKDGAADVPETPAAKSDATKEIKSEEGNKEDPLEP